MTAQSRDFDELYREILKLARYTARYALGDSDIADDIAQDVAIKLWNIVQADPNAIDVTRELKGWVTTAAQRRVADHLKASRTKSTDADADPDQHADAHWSSNPEARLLNDELYVVAQRAIDALSPRRLECFLMVRERDKTREEAAEALGVSIRTVDSMLAAINQDLRNTLGKYLQEGR